ncbi:MAG: pentapeptide repeat-containing protein [Spirochaetota bacterium]
MSDENKLTKLSPVEIIYKIDKDNNIYYENAEIFDDLDFTTVKDTAQTNTNTYRSYVNSSLVFKNCTFDGEVKSSKYSGNVRNYTTFQRDIIFINCCFKKNVNFEASFIQGSSIFIECEFSEKLIFSYARFGQSPVNFANSLFKGLVDFSFIQTGGEVNFKDTQFQGSANFFNSIFLSRLYFMRSIFQANSTFEFSLFNGISDFSLSEFYGKADFKKAQFNGHSYFKEVIFNDTTDFWQALFLGRVDFKEAQFDKLAYFEHVRFLGDADFNYAVFKGSADFWQAQFMGSEDDFKMTKFKGLKFFEYATRYGKPFEP